MNLIFSFEPIVFAFNLTENDVIWVYFMNHSLQRQNIAILNLIFSQKFENSVSISIDFLFPIWLSLLRSLIVILSHTWSIELIFEPQNQFLT